MAQGLVQRGSRLFAFGDEDDGSRSVNVAPVAGVGKSCSATSVISKRGTTVAHHPISFHMLNANDSHLCNLFTPDLLVLGGRKVRNLLQKFAPHGTRRLK